MFYVRYPLIYRQVEGILRECRIGICHETLRFWVGRFGLKFAHKFEIRGQGTTQIGNGIYFRFSSKLTVKDFTYGGLPIMKVKFWSVTFQNEERGTMQKFKS